MDDGDFTSLWSKIWSMWLLVPPSNTFILLPEIKIKINIKNIKNINIIIFRLTSPLDFSKGMKSDSFHPLQGENIHVSSRQKNL
jgi:hypothetical protein